MKYCLGSNDKKGKSVHIQYGCNFPQEFATWLNLGIWRTGDNKKRDVLHFCKLLMLGLMERSSNLIHHFLPSVVVCCFD